MYNAITSLDFLVLRLLNFMYSRLFMVRGPVPYTHSGTPVITAKNKEKCGFVFADGPKFIKYVHILKENFFWILNKF